MREIKDAKHLLFAGWTPLVPAIPPERGLPKSGRARLRVLNRLCLFFLPRPYRICAEIENSFARVRREGRGFGYWAGRGYSSCLARTEYVQRLRIVLQGCAGKGEASGVERAVFILPASPVQNAEQYGDIDGFGRGRGIGC
jgi:hypothetical protein